MSDAMSFELRFAIVVLAAFAWSSVAGAWIVAALWRRHLEARPADRATALVRLRLLPLAVGGTVATLAAIAFLRFEPRDITESIGGVLAALAAASAVFVVAAAVRLCRMWLRTRRAVRGWLATAEPVALSGISAPALVIDSPFPVVAVVGLFRPRLLIARSVMGACRRDELRAILAHEQEHIARGDNLRRLALGAAPDLLGWLPLSRRIQSAWLEAAEDAADDGARRLGADGRAVLAQALIRVARLASGTPPVELPASTLFRGASDLDRRVRRLLEPAPPVPARRPRRFGWALAGGFVAVALLLLEDIHDLVEAAVTYLP
jgi:Zn-dependent protease with chaperone function